MPSAKREQRASYFLCFLVASSFNAGGRGRETEEPAGRGSGGRRRRVTVDFCAVYSPRVGENDRVSLVPSREHQILFFCASFFLLCLFALWFSLAVVFAALAVRRKIQGGGREDGPRFGTPSLVALRFCRVIGR